MAASRIWPFALNAVSLLSLLTGIYFAVQVHRKPLLAWDVPLHLSYQDIGTVGHSRSLARYDADLWNHAVQVGGGVIVAITLAAFQRHRNGQFQRAAQPTSGPGLRRSPNSATSSLRSGFGFDFGSNISLGTILVSMIAGAGLSSSLLGMHPATWATTSPIGAVSTAAITAELTRVPAATPWDMSSVMLRSAFERAVAQKPYGLAATHSYLARHFGDEQGVRVGRTVYPSICTHGVGVAPAPWERRGYHVPVDQGRVLAYAPIVAATNVTVQCTDSTEERAWGYEVHEFASAEEPDQPNTIIHRFHVSPKTDWRTNGPRQTVTYVDGDKGFNLKPWQALKKVGNEPVHADNMEVHQIFLFTNVGPINHVPEIILLDCRYGGVDVIRQVTMTSPLEPTSIGEIIDTKDALDMEDLYPAASAIDSALGRDGGALLAGMAAAGVTSLEMWDYVRGRTKTPGLSGLVEHVLVDTAQAYFSLVRQWREEAQFFSWPREVAAGNLTATSKRIGAEGGAAVGAVVVLGLLALLPLSALTSLSRAVVRDYRR
ncbi:uncharacterized protein THITE_2114195 [Thermothielavioides terrestris NRRL 8126]|uniref:Uncharacterized protein n=1 Tax=Thermothielavioides terrestris (strain ATCC 38088 / NRRL 8126) TaxID=578455 RepID=G2QYD0_THETT|nr:uncharacterized protein THITE_2114195 [Thermothielavioides terrestris NRRL 8126]AEO66228.1 hypothetical protein THITE_2114195 [Thermothielavioides terrestris NRRL 8126]